MDLPERVADRIEHSGTCWLWTGSTRKGGYGQISVAVGNGRRQTKSVHRYVYEYVRGPIPDGLDLDHLCRTTRCCNPDHLEPVTRRTNILRGTAPAAVNARKTHCAGGHPLVPHPKGHRRHCPICDDPRLGACVTRMPAVC